MSEKPKTNYVPEECNGPKKKVKSRGIPGVVPMGMGKIPLEHLSIPSLHPQASGRTSEHLYPHTEKELSLPEILERYKDEDKRKVKVNYRGEVVEGRIIAVHWEKSYDKSYFGVFLEGPKYRGTRTYFTKEDFVC